MKKLIFVGIGVLLIAGLAVLAQKTSNPENEQLAQWEKMAESGDTAAMHRLIEFYDENSDIYVEVAEVLDADGDEWTASEVDSLNNANKRSAELSEKYSKRLNYWVEKGTSIDDPIALFAKGMRLYYVDGHKAIEYLSKAANKGNAQAALFCGSAYMDQQQGDEAFRYLSLAYELGAPSAGWHLARCYSAGIGTERNREKAIEVMRHAADMDYPEAVSEMQRIEPTNPRWQHKADSLHINFPDFPIIQ